MKNRLKTTLLLFIITIIYSAINAQEIIKPEMGTYTSPEGKLFWHKDLPVYIWISSSPESEKMLMQSKDEHKKYVNPYYFDMEGDNFI